MKIRALIFAGLLISTPMSSIAEEDHHDHNSGHSDALLFLLQHKIVVSKLQDKFDGLAHQQKIENLEKQGQRLEHAMPILQTYLATPESRYPNMDIYHQSLQSRGALLNDYTQLLVRFQQQSAIHP